MNFNISRTDFLSILDVAQSVVEKKNVMPILANVLVEANAQKNMVSLTATDLEVAVFLVCPAKVEKGGNITVNAKNLCDIVRESASSELSFEVGGNDRVHIRSNQSDYKILGLQASEFPSLPVVEGTFHRVGSQDLQRMFELVSFAMSSDETRYHLNGVLIEKSDKGTVMVATDGHRLSVVVQPIDLGWLKQNRVILPRKGVNELQRLFSREKFTDVCVSERHVFFKTEKQNLYIRLIDGNFPDYQRVVPQGNTIQITIPRKELSGAIKRVSLLSDDSSKGVSFYFCNKSLTVSSSNPSLGEAKEEIAIDYKGQIFTIGFNAKYFFDVLNVITDENIILSFKDEISPCLITCASEPNFKSVIMPMRL